VKSRNQSSKYEINKTAAKVTEKLNKSSDNNEKKEGIQHVREN